MPTIRSQLPYKLSPDLAKVQAGISPDDKRTVVAALAGDDAILTFIIQTAFLRTATFIRTHGLNVYSPASFDRILSFVRNGTDTCPPGQADAHDDDGGAKTRKPKAKATRNATSTPPQIHP